MVSLVPPVHGAWSAMESYNPLAHAQRVFRMKKGGKLNRTILTATPSTPRPCSAWKTTWTVSGRRNRSA